MSTSSKANLEALKAFIEIAQQWSMTGNGNNNQTHTSLHKAEGASSESNKSDTPLSDDELLKIHIQNYREKLSVYKPKLSAVIDQPDFQPVSFLQSGLDKSYAVCRISRYYSREALKQTFKNLREKYEELKKTKIDLDELSFFNPAEELKSSFLIPKSLYHKIFDEKNQQNPKITYLKSLDSLEAHIDELLKLNPIPIGTGFLVGNSHLLTNHHVMPTPEIARECVAQFGYEDAPTKMFKTLDYEFDSNLLFVTNPQLDYTLVQLQTDTFTKRPAGYNFGWLDLIESEDGIAPRLNKDKVQKLIETLIKDGYESEQLKSYGLNETEDLDGDRVAIIQHPRGRKKEIVLQNNEVIQLSSNDLVYQADTDYGSSGSPVFNMKWELVALTKGVILDDTKNLETNNGNGSDNQKLFFDWIASKGTRICRIVEDLKKNSFTNPKLKSFIEDFVFTSEQFNSAPLPSGLEFDGESSYVDLSVNKGSDDFDAITVEAWVQVHPGSRNGTIIHQDKAYALSLEQGRLHLSFDYSDDYVYTYEAFPDDSLWHHVAFTYDSKNQEKPIIMYVDGEQKNTNISNQKTIPNFLKNQYYLYKLYIGYCKYKMNNDYFKGSISEIRLWKVAHEQPQIQNHMKHRLDAAKEVGLMGYWRFEEGEEYKVYNLASDSSKIASKPSNIDTISNSKTQYPPSSGLEFNGVYDYIDCGNNASLHFRKAITMEAWVKVNKKAKNGTIINQGGGWTEPGYCLWFYNKKIRVELCDDGRHPIFIDTQDNFSEGSWHHIAFTWYKASKTHHKFQIYIDGENKEVECNILSDKQESESLGKEGNENIVNIREDKRYFQGLIGKPEVNLNIGRAQKYAHYFNGSIAEVRLWNVARTHEQINADKDRILNGNENGLVAYWQLDDEEGDQAISKINNSKIASSVYGGKWLKPYHLMEENQFVYGVTFRTKRLTACQYPALPLPFGKKFSDKNDELDYYLNCGEKNLHSLKEITVEAWVKQQFGNCLIVNHDRDLQQHGKIGTGYSLSWHEGRIRVILSDGNSENTTIIYSKNNDQSDNMWHHIAFTWNNNPGKKAKGEIAIYIDGRYQDCIVEGKSNALIIQGQSKTTGIFTGSLDKLKTHLTIGAIGANDTYRNFEIAEVRLWKVARTQQQIQANMYRRLESQYFLDGDEQRFKERDNLIGYWRLDNETI
jgi:hypothetical protein